MLKIIISIRVLETVGSPTARKYSLLFGGAYAPNDAIYRKRYAFTDALIKLLVFFWRVADHATLLRCSNTSQNAAYERGISSATAFKSEVFFVAVAANTSAKNSTPNPPLRFI